MKQQQYISPPSALPGKLIIVLYKVSILLLLLCYGRQHQCYTLRVPELLRCRDLADYLYNYILGESIDRWETFLQIMRFQRDSSMEQRHHRTQL